MYLKANVFVTWISSFPQIPCSFWMILLRKVPMVHGVAREGILHLPSLLLTVCGWSYWLRSLSGPPVSCTVAPVFPGALPLLPPHGLPPSGACYSPDRVPPLLALPCQCWFLQDDLVLSVWKVGLPMTVSCRPVGTGSLSVPHLFLPFQAVRLGKLECSLLAWEQSPVRCPTVHTQPASRWVLRRDFLNLNEVSSYCVFVHGTKLRILFPSFTWSW